uniref:EF-hand domain-containing protein n=1 Tax=Macrostomum lignano TaxID=282301 RepID=A0A1I8IGW4_9PLAT
MKALGQRPSEAELRDMMKQVDEDGDGNIDFAEFVKMMSDRLITEAEVQRKRQSRMRKAFAVRCLGSQDCGCFLHV